MWKFGCALSWVTFYQLVSLWEEFSSNHLKNIEIVKWTLTTVFIINTFLWKLASNLKSSVLIFLSVFSRFFCCLIINYHKISVDLKFIYIQFHMLYSGTFRFCVLHLSSQIQFCPLGWRLSVWNIWAIFQWFPLNLCMVQCTVTLCRWQQHAWS